MDSLIDEVLHSILHSAIWRSTWHLDLGPVNTDCHCCGDLPDSGLATKSPDQTQKNIQTKKINYYCLIPSIEK